MASTIRMYGALWCGDCKRAKQFFGEHRIEYQFIDIDEHPEAQEVVKQYNSGKQIIPTIVFPDGTVLVEPSNAELAVQMKLQTVAARHFYDLIVVGGGPAGLTAALYTAREGIDTLVIERGAVGGQVGITERLDNFPGFPEGIGGDAFADRLRAQAERFGVEILSAQDVIGLEVSGDYRVVRTAAGHEYCARAVLLTVGSTYRRLGIPGEEDFIGAGVHFCATCDGAFYRDQDVLVIGGGNSAADEGLFLTRFARSVTIIARGPRLDASQAILQKIDEHPEIRILPNSEAVAFRGQDYLEAVTVRNRLTGETQEMHPGGVFVFVGQQPNTERFAELLERDGNGFLVTDATLQTNVAGVFTAGDVRAGSTKQAASAAGEGAAVALSVRRYLEPYAGKPHTVAGSMDMVPVPA